MTVRLCKYHVGSDSLRRSDFGYYRGDFFSLGTNILAFSLGLDVVAHEYSHLVTKHESDLMGMYEPGALNEGVFREKVNRSDQVVLIDSRSHRNLFFTHCLRCTFFLELAMSDIMGATIEHVVKKKSAADTFRMGEDVYVTSQGLRNMENPHVFGDPDFYPTRSIGPSVQSGSCLFVVRRSKF